MQLSRDYYSAQGWHMITVAEEVARAVQIASAPQEILKSSSSDTQKIANSSASNAQEIAAPSISLPLPISSPDTITIQRSPAFSLSFQSSSNGEVDVAESCFENLRSSGGCLLL